MVCPLTFSILRRRPLALLSLFLLYLLLHLFQVVTITTYLYTSFVQWVHASSSFYFFKFLTIDRLIKDTFEIQSYTTQLRFCQVSSFGPSARPRQTYIMSRTSRKYPHKSFISLRGQICHSHYYNLIKRTLKFDVELDEKQQYI